MGALREENEDVGCAPQAPTAEKSREKGEVTALGPAQSGPCGQLGRKDTVVEV